MSDPRNAHPQNDDLRTDAGDPNRDRADLADLPPARAAESVADDTLIDADDEHDDPTAAQ
jgi:hypothetical protein